MLCSTCLSACHDRVHLRRLIRHNNFPAREEPPGSSLFLIPVGSIAAALVSCHGVAELAAVEVDADLLIRLGSVGDLGDGLGNCRSEAGSGRVSKMMDFNVDMAGLPRNQLHRGKAYGKMISTNRHLRR